MRILSIGECMAELAPSTATGEFRLGFAGDTFNTAWYLARIAPELAVSYYTAIGDDALSKRMRGEIAGCGIDISYIRSVPGRSVGLYMIELHEGERSFSYWRGASAARQLAGDRSALASAIAASDLIYFSGITLAILEADGRDTLIDALREARDAGKHVAFDPNLRPNLWTTPAEMTKVIMRAAATSTTALPSFEDEADWFGDVDPRATLDRYSAVGATTVVVKNGARDVLYRKDGVTGSVKVIPVAPIIDTTAAGDSFNAAILAGIAAKAPLAASIGQACRLAGQVVRGNGALVEIGQSVAEHAT